MQREIAKALVEALGRYGTALEYGLRVNRLLAGSTERMLRAHVELADAAAERIAGLAEVTDPRELAAVQRAMLRELGEESLAMLEDLVAIQRETRADFEALAEEGIDALTPAAVKSVPPKAA